MKCSYLLPALIALIFCLPQTGAADEAEAKLKTIDTEEAVLYAGVKCRVKFEVKSSTFLRDKNVVFLNSEKNYRDEENFTVVIFKEALKKFAAAKIDDPAAKYKGKTILVTGGIRLRSGKAQIIVDEPDQISIVEKKPDEE